MIIEDFFNEVLIAKQEDCFCERLIGVLETEYFCIRDSMTLTIIFENFYISDNIISTDKLLSFSISSNGMRNKYFVIRKERYDNLREAIRKHSMFTTEDDKISDTQMDLGSYIRKHKIKNLEI